MKLASKSIVAEVILKLIKFNKIRAYRPALSRNIALTETPGCSIAYWCDNDAVQMHQSACSNPTAMKS